MTRPAHDLFPRIAAFDNLLVAARRAALGKRDKPAVALFLANLEPRLLALQERLLAGTWRSGGYTRFEVKEPKPRMISAAPFADRVVHHALCAVVAPIFEKRFIHDSYANRKGYGTHRAVARYERFRDRHPYVLRCDIYRYFPALDHEILKRDLRRYIACEPTLALLDGIIDDSNLQEEVLLHFPGDDLFSPLERRRGLPIGNLTSQWLGNLYLNPMDHFIKEVLRVPDYLRYVDDFALFGDSPTQLADWRSALETWLEGRRLRLHPAKTRLLRTAAPAEFLGYELLPGGRRRLPPGNVHRFTGRLAALRRAWRQGDVDEDTVRQRVVAWVAHAGQADTVCLRHKLFRGGWFDPLWEFDGPGSRRVVRGGSWNNNPDNTRSANRNNNGADNRNNTVGFRLASTPLAGTDAIKVAPGVPVVVQGSSEKRSSPVRLDPDG